MSKQSLLYPQRNIQQFYKSSIKTNTSTFAGNQLLEQSNEIEYSHKINILSDSNLNSIESTPQIKKSFHHSNLSNGSTTSCQDSKIESLKCSKQSSKMFGVGGGNYKFQILFQKNKPPLHNQTRETSPKQNISQLINLTSARKQPSLEMSKGGISNQENKQQFKQNNNSQFFSRNQPIKILGTEKVGKENIQTSQKQKQQEIYYKSVNQEAGNYKNKNDLKYEKSQCTIKANKKQQYLIEDDIQDEEEGQQLQEIKYDQNQIEERIPFKNKIRNSSQFKSLSQCNSPKKKQCNNIQDKQKQKNAQKINSSRLPLQPTFSSTQDQNMQIFSNQQKFEKVLDENNEEDDDIGENSDIFNQELSSDDFEDDIIPLFNKSKKKESEILSSQSRATSASKRKVFSPQLDEFVDIQIKNVLEGIQVKKQQEKLKMELKCKLSLLNEEISGIQSKVYQQEQKEQNIISKQKGLLGSIQDIKNDVIAIKEKIGKFKIESEKQSQDLIKQRNTQMEQLNEQINQNEMKSEIEDQELLQFSQEQEKLKKDIQEAQKVIDQLQKEVKIKKRSMDSYIKKLKVKSSFLTEVYSSQKMVGLNIARGKQSINQFQTTQKDTINNNC